MYKTKIKIIFAFVILLTQCSSQEKNGIYYITKYGAKPNGSIVTKEIQATIDQCYNNGGGKVIIPPGEFITGTLNLLSNVELHLSAGAILKGSTDTLDYIMDGTTRQGVIHAENAENITISGRGTIDGNGTYFHKLDVSHDPGDFDRSHTRQGNSYMRGTKVFEDGPVAYDFRPGMALVFFNCENVELKDFLLKDTPEWAIRFGQCDDVLVDGITIRNNLLIPNSDGIHCTSSRNIKIANCDIQAGDDAIIVSGFKNRINVDGEVDGEENKTLFGNKTKYAENISVSNCILQSRSAGIRIGYGSTSMRNLVFQNIVIYGSNRGIGVFARDETGNIENVMFSNIIIQNRIHNGHWWGNGEPIHVSTIPRKGNKFSGKIKNIVFKDIIAKSETGIVVYGLDDNPIEELVFDNINLTINNGKYVKTYGGNIDLRPTANVETDIFKHDVPGIYAKNLKNSEIRNCKVYWGNNLEDFHTFGMELENCKNIEIDNFKGTNAFPQKDNRVIYKSNCENIKIK